MNKTIQHVLFLGLLTVLSVSCVTQKKLTYLQDAGPDIMDSVNAQFKAQSETVIRSGDALTVYVAALDREAVAPYNLPSATYSMPGEGEIETKTSLQFFVVSEEGDIELPVLGKVHVAGLKRAEVEKTIQEMLEKQVLNPIVHVDLIGAKVTVLGEVNQPCQVEMKHGRLTILEALAAAGDVTPYGKRENVLVTREVDGKLELARLDLRSSDLYTSPYYYLQQNDVVYVSPNQVRVVQSTNIGLYLSMVSTLASAATVIVTVVSLTNNRASSSSGSSGNTGN